MKLYSKRYGKTYRKIFSSYIIIFLLPLLTGLLFYLYTYHTTKLRTDETNRRAIQTIKQYGDREIGSYLNNAMQIALNREVQLLSGSGSETFRDSDFYTLYNLYDGLKNIKASCNIYKEYCKEIFVYFQNGEKVVSSSGNMTYSMFYDLYGRNRSLNEQQLREYLAQFHYNDVLRLEPESEGGKGMLLLTMSNIKASWGLENTVVGILLNEDILNDIIDSLRWQGGDMLVLNSDNQILNRSLTDAEQYGLDYNSLVSGEDSTLLLDGENYIMQTENSSILDWKYVSLLPESEVSGPAKQVRNVFMLESILCIIAGFVISWRMTQINYNPLENLLDMMHPRKTQDEEVDRDSYGGNEYLYLQKRTRELLKEHADFKHMVTDNQKIIHQYYLNRLLEAPYDIEKIEEKDKRIGQFKDGSNMVVLLTVQEETAPDEKAKTEEERLEEEDRKDSLKKFIIENVLLEQLRQSFEAELVDIGEMLVLIAHFEDEEKGKERLAEVVDSTQKFIYQNFKFHVVALAGTCYAGLSGVHQSYIEARELVELVPQLESDYISYEEVKNAPNQNYCYSVDTESRVIAAMQAGNVNLALSYIKTVLDTNNRQTRNSPVMKRCLFYDILGTIMKAASEMGVRNLEEYEFFGQLTSRVSTTEMLQNFEKLISALCEECVQKEEAGGVDSGSQLSTKVMEYIRENYQNPDLNISQTGLYFHMTPAYLSMLFKKQTGDSLLKFITQVRVDAARKLLEEGKNVSEVAEMVGFRDVSTFIRVFKKATGVTPGQVRAK
ncbi:MAG: helix-turn-helix domain-containing protein [bacterium]|nr:helix-turn-helix domain-containing protein [bacterium]